MSPHDDKGFTTSSSNGRRQNYDGDREQPDLEDGNESEWQSSKKKKRKFNGRSAKACDSDLTSFSGALKVRVEPENALRRLAPSCVLAAEQAAALASTWRASPKCWPDPFIHELRTLLQRQIDYRNQEVDDDDDDHRRAPQTWSNSKRARANAVLIIRAICEVQATRKSLQSRYDDLYIPMTEELKIAYALDLAIRAFLKDDDHYKTENLVRETVQFAIVFVPRLSSGVFKYMPILDPTDADHQLLQDMVATIATPSEQANRTCKRA